jgi:predicted cupin superfamily sugar epimerase
MQTQTASYWIERLQLWPHPEGGYYKEVFRSRQKVLRFGANVPRRAFTSIYYLLEGNDFSGFHRIDSDEIWYFHKGSPLLIHVIDEQGAHTAIELSDTDNGNLSVTISAGLWFAVEIPSASGYALASCAVAPGFEFSEFEMAEKSKMTALYPRYAGLFDKFCRL